MTRVVDPDSDAYTKETRLASKRAMPTQASADLAAIGAPQVWSEEQGDGVRLAVIDTRRRHRPRGAARRTWSTRSSERGGDDFDGNGVPGDEFGVNLAHLAIARGADGTRLGLGAHQQRLATGTAPTSARAATGATAPPIASIAAGSAARARAGSASRRARRSSPSTCRRTCARA